MGDGFQLVFEQLVRQERLARVLPASQSRARAGDHRPCYSVAVLPALYISVVYRLLSLEVFGTAGLLAGFILPLEILLALH